MLNHWLMFNMDSLIEHVNAKEQFQVFAVVLLKVLEGLFRCRVIRIGHVNVRGLVDAPEPLLYVGLHFLHVREVSAKDEVFACRVLDMFGEYLVKSLGVFESLMEFFEDYFCFSSHGLAFRLLGTGLQFFIVFLYAYIDVMYVGGFNIPRTMASPSVISEAMLPSKSSSAARVRI